jgi:2-iminoacetate synthase
VIRAAAPRAEPPRDGAARLTDRDWRANTRAMDDFRLDEEEVRAVLARGQAAADGAAHLVATVRAGEALDPTAIAALWFDRQVDTVTLVAAARAARGPRGAHLETFSPLYLTNTCDAACRMCGMRRDNAALVRETAGAAQIEAQLRILLGRGMRAVALLTGEYRGERRRWAMRYVNAALRLTGRLGFNHVLVNVGAIDDDEFPVLLDGITRRADGTVAPKLTMCTFQESYARRTYAKFMGRDADNPRADYERRLANFDRARRAGMRVANPGVLLGLSNDVAFEMVAAVLHVRHLLAAGMEVYLSTPRLRRVAGGGNGRGIADDDFVRLVALFALALPAAKLVVTTREPRAIQQRVAPLVSVLSAGSAAVAPYSEEGARFPLEQSQFEVIDQRPFEAILREHLDAGVAIENFAPPG